MNALAKLLCSGVRAAIFRVLFGVESREVHLRELQRQAGFALATVRQDLAELTKMGLVVRRQDGNRVYYSANRGHPLFTDIRQLVLKTVGLRDVLATALSSDGVRCAFVFGSTAAATQRPESDIDLMVVGHLSLRKLCGLLSGIDQQLGREINPHALTPAEFAKRQQRRDHFLTAVLESPKLFVVGSEHELATMGGQRLVEEAPDEPARNRKPARNRPA